MKSCKRVFVACACLSVMISAAGCASKEVVKKDESLGGKEVTAKPSVASTAGTKAAGLEKEVPKTVAPTAPTVATGNLSQPAKAAVKQSALEKVYFNFDSSDLSKSSRDSLSRNAEVLLKEQKNAKVRIEGNCDERGSAEYNLALGERRAKAAAKYLAALGVQPERLAILSYGKEKPAVQGSDEASWSKNRRDEFVIIK